MRRREFIRISGAAGLSAYVSTKLGFVQRLFAQVPGGTLDPASVPKYLAALVRPPVFRRVGRLNRRGMKNADYYEIAMRQFQQQILPAGTAPATTVWSYGPAAARTTDLANGFSYPAFTLENKWRRPAVVKWVNELVDGQGGYLPHLLPVDQTLHWANPVGPRDRHGTDQAPYAGPVPMVTHVHGAHTPEESDGYPEAWYLPDANNIPGYIQHATGSFYDYFNNRYGAGWGPGFATFAYPNDQRATTLWYHDHTLGMTRTNVYAGPAGFYLLRGGPDDSVLDGRTGMPAVLPGPAPGPGLDPFGTFYEIPIVIQDRSFNADGSLFYPDTRAFFEGLEPGQLIIPFTPDPGCDGLPSDVAPIWNPEFFGNVMVVNGQSWPVLDVEQRRYRFRLLNGCDSRFLILDFGNIPGVEVWQIGSDGGFLPAPVNVTAGQSNRLLMGPAERADLIVDFTHAAQGTHVLGNVAPDEPFGGGTPGVDFDPADPNTTGQVLAFRVGPALAADSTTPPMFLQLPAITPVTPTGVRRLSLNEEESKNVFANDDGLGGVVLDCGSSEPFGPTAALLGTLAPDGSGVPKLWMDPVTENPAEGTAETWEFHNFTADAHPIHVHLVQFQVVDRQPFGGAARPPEATESGFKDTVIAYPGEITRVKMQFDRAGFFVWHCHILEHEDNEMMRPYHVGPVPPDAPAQ